MCCVMGFQSSLYSEAEIRPFFDRTKSRGPDDTRIEAIPGGMLCFHRLSIMGLHDAGMQPFSRGKNKVLCNVPKEEFPAQTLTCELYLEAGIRGCEIGYILADRDPVTRENRFGGLDLLRLCIARRVYTDNHMNVIAAALKNVYDRRHEITRGVAIEWEAPLMRHFTVQLKRLKS